MTRIEVVERSFHAYEFRGAEPDRVPVRKADDPVDDDARTQEPRLESLPPPFEGPVDRRRRGGQPALEDLECG